MSSSEAARIPIFAALSAKDRDKVLGNAIQRTYAPGATLVKEGETSMNLFFIVSGTAEVATAEEGHRRNLGPGDFFGEIGLLETERRTATVVAATPMRVIVMFQREFKHMEQEMPAVADRVRSAIRARLDA